MRVLYDGVIFQNAYQRGIQRVFRELIQNFDPSHNLQPALLLAERAKAALPAGITTRRPALVKSGVGDLLPRKLRRRLIPALSVRSIRNLCNQSDIFHSTYFNLPPVSTRIPVVVHIYDMIIERHSDLFSGKAIDAEVRQKAHAFDRADAIIAISEFTKAEVEHFYPAVKGKITAIHLGREHLEHQHASADINSSSQSPAASLAHIPTIAGVGHYALFVGDRALYKNFSAILDAMELSDWPADIALVVVGSPWKANEALRIERLTSLGRRICLAGRVSESDLALLYRAAHCVIVPSISEGFGFPVLEAQTARTPVVCSDIPVFRELLISPTSQQPSALFFDPFRPDQLGDRVAQTQDPSLRSALIHAGSVNFSRFSWKSCSTQTHEIYARLLNQ